MDVGHEAVAPDLKGSFPHYSVLHNHTCDTHKPELGWQSSDVPASFVTWEACLGYGRTVQAAGRCPSVASVFEDTGHLQTAFRTLTNEMSV